MASFSISSLPDEHKPRLIYDGCRVQARPPRPTARSSVGQAAGALGTTHQNIKQLVDALERKGFVRIAADPADRRIRRLATTPQSDATWQRRSHADQRRVLEWFGNLTAVKAQDLFGLLLKTQASVRAVATDDNDRSDELAS